MANESTSPHYKQSYLLGRHIKRAHHMSKLALSHFQQIPVLLKEAEQMNAILKIQRVEKNLKDLNKKVCTGTINLNESERLMRDLQYQLSKHVFTVVYMLAERARLVKYLDSI